jgi:hypothetical protein
MRRRAAAASEKYGDTLDHSNALFRTYNPVDIEKVKQTESSEWGRLLRNKGSGYLKEL